MKIITILILSILLSSCLENNRSDNFINQNEISDSISVGLSEPIEMEPVFSGGNENVLNYFRERLTVNNKGNLNFRFTVDSIGKVHSPEIIKNTTELKTEYITKRLAEILDSMPSWKSGQINGKNVNVIFQVPLKFNGK